MEQPAACCPFPASTTASAPQRHTRSELVPRAMKHILQGVLPPAIHEMITCSKLTTCPPLAFHQKGALGKCQDEHERDHRSSQQGPDRLLKSIIDGSDLLAPRDGAAVRLASSSLAVRCRRLPIAYRLLVARSDVAAAKQARLQSPRGSPRRTRWAGPLARLNQGQERCMPHQFFRPFGAPSLRRRLALFEHTWWFGQLFEGRAESHGPSAAARRH